MIFVMFATYELLGMDRYDIKHENEYVDSEIKGIDNKLYCMSNWK